MFVPFFLLLFVLLRPLTLSSLGLVVPTKFGPIKGFVQSLPPPLNAFRFRSIDVFLGIPFATPPIGPLRFEMPVPPKPWHAVRPALTPMAPCVPHAREECQNKCSEDCLYLNVFSPHQRRQRHSLRMGASHRSASFRRHRRLFPVLVLIHGGAFEIGSAADFDNFTDLGRRYVSAGIVVVAIQYRLGVIGFASTGDKQMAGNFGLWDQFAALTFVSENIAQFGGNPADITLFGESAGAASASFLGLSPHSQALFHKSVQLSGSPLSAWACNRRVISETAKLATAVNCAQSGQQEEGIKQCMKRKTVDELFDGVQKVGMTRQEADFTKWGPHLDGDFLPMDIPQLIGRAPRKPTVIGIADLESLFWTAAIGHNTSVSLFAIPLDEMDLYGRRRFELFVQNFVAKPDLFGEQMAAELQREIVHFYTTDQFAESIDQPGYYFRKMNLILSDLQFIVPAIWEAVLKAQNGWPIYFFKNNYINDIVLPKAVKVRQNFHINDFIYLFDRKVHRFEFNEDDKRISNFLMDTLIAFVKSGNPSERYNGQDIRWLTMAPANSSQSFAHLLIDAPMPEMNPKMEEESRRAQFWAQMRTKYRSIDLVRGEF